MKKTLNALVLTLLISTLVLATHQPQPARAAPAVNGMADAGKASPLHDPPPPEPLAQGGRPLSRVAVVTMPSLDIPALLAEDVQREAAGLPPRFAQPIPVRITPATHGTWDLLPGGRVLWRLRIASPGALSLNLGFAHYSMPAGGQLFLYTPDYRIVRGPFTAADNEAHGQLWSPILLDDEIVVELSLPASALSGLQLELTSVNHGYVEFGHSPSPDSGICNLDVVCSAADGYPQVDAWRDEIRSVAVISTGGSTFCTGFLVNNTAEDLRGYFMTANHCGINNGNAPSLVTYWNYQNSWCRPVGDPINGQPGDGTLDQFNTGSIFRAAYSASDFTLVELDDPIDPGYNVHWAGWDATPADASSAVAIHHPNTDEKRISFENDPTTTTSYLGTSVPGDGTHVRITDWDLGTTEPGSSGSPLFNQDHHVIGQLHGGYAACGNNESDWYGRFSVSWDRTGSSPTNRLRDWLDPGNTGQLVQDGRDRIEAPFTLTVTPEEVSVCAPGDGVYDVTVGVATPGFDEPVTLAASGNPAGTTAVFGANPVVPTTTTTLVIGNTGAAIAGNYALDVVGQYLTNTLTNTVAFNLFTALPGLPTLVAPADGATDQSFTPDFQWTDTPPTSTYNWQLDSGPLFLAPLMAVNDIPATTYAVTTPLEGGRCYWWRVQGNNACGTGAWAEPFHFATAVLGIAFADDMESGSGNWSHAAAQGTDHWQLSTAQSHSPTHAWFVPDDNTITDSRLWNTASVPIGSASTLTFWHRYQFEGSSYDGSVLEISADGGPWTDLGPYITAGGYNGVISSGYSNPLGGRQGWTGDLTTWTQVVVDLSAYAGQNVQIRWRLGCDSSVSDVGWYIDDVEITAPLPPNPAPTLTAITPGSGTPYSPTPVVVSGSSFVGTPSLRLGETWLLSVTLVSSTTLNAVVPAGMAEGTYDLTLVNGDCQDAVLPDAFTVVSECISPTIALLDSDSPVELGQPMHFVATVDGTEPFSYVWDFGGPGTGEGLDTATPVFTYTTYGTFTVALTVDNGCGSDAESLPVEVTCTAPDATFTSDSPVLVGEPMHFVATVGGTPPFGYAWDFGGPGYGEGLDTPTPVFTYTAYGTYTVALTVDNGCGSDEFQAEVKAGYANSVYLPVILRNTP